MVRLITRRHCGWTRYCWRPWYSGKVLREACSLGGYRRKNLRNRDEGKKSRISSFGLPGACPAKGFSFSHHATDLMRRGSLFQLFQSLLRVIEGSANTGQRSIGLAASRRLSLQLVVAYRHLGAVRVPQSDAFAIFHDCTCPIESLSERFSERC